MSSVLNAAAALSTENPRCGLGHVGEVNLTAMHEGRAFESELFKTPYF